MSVMVADVALTSADSFPRLFDLIDEFEFSELIQSPVMILGRLLTVVP